jgi:hypothetical protein
MVKAGPSLSDACRSFSEACRLSLSDWKHRVKWSARVAPS